MLFLNLPIPNNPLDLHKKVENELFLHLYAAYLETDGGIPLSQYISVLKVMPSEKDSTCCFPRTTPLSAKGYVRSSSSAVCKFCDLGIE